MTREEERYKEARLYQISNPIINHSERSLKDIQLSAYVSGAEWADKHPRKGLVDINKVCEWLKENGYYFGEWWIPNEDVIQMFRKAMEE